MKLFDVYPLYDVVPTHAKDVYVYDDKGIKYLDLYGGHAVISIGHGHKLYKDRLTKQLNEIGFYSNAVKNPLQQQLADNIGKHSHCNDYQLFLCSSGAEANENAATDNLAINAPLNLQQDVTFLPFNDEKLLEVEIKKGDVCAVIFEAIQGVGGLDEPSEEFIYTMDRLCKTYNICLIADEVQSGFSRSGTFFAYQKCSIKPNIITMAKGMGNGFPVGGILAHSSIESKYGMLGTTFGGNHLACSASLAVLDVIKNEGLQEHAKKMGNYFIDFAQKISSVKKVKGRGLMLGLEFDFPVGPLRKELIYNQHIFTGGSSNKNLLRILPPLTIQKKHFDIFFQKLEEALKAINV